MNDLLVFLIAFDAFALILLILLVIALRYEKPFVIPHTCRGKHDKSCAYYLTEVEAG